MLACLHRQGSSQYWPSYSPTNTPESQWGSAPGTLPHRLYGKSAGEAASQGYHLLGLALEAPCIIAAAIKSANYSRRQMALPLLAYKPLSACSYHSCYLRMCKCCMSMSMFYIRLFPMCRSTSKSHNNSYQNRSFNCQHSKCNEHSAPAC